MTEVIIRKETERRKRAVKETLRMRQKDVNFRVKRHLSKIDEEAGTSFLFIFCINVASQHSCQSTGGAEVDILINGPIVVFFFQTKCRYRLATHLFYKEKICI